MKRILLSLLVTTLLSGCAFLKNRYAQEPEIHLQKIYLQEVQLLSATMIVVLSVKNPNKVDLKVDEITYDIKLNDEDFTQSKISDKVALPAGETKLVEIPLPINYLKALNGVSKVLSGEDVTYVVSGKAKVSGFTIPFSEKGTLNLNSTSK